MKNLSLAAGLILLISLSSALVAEDGLVFHDDYYLGFSQGAYYGLMLAGVDYDVAWCMKSELAYEASAMGSGGEFQEKMNGCWLSVAKRTRIANDCAGIEFGHKAAPLRISMRAPTTIIGDIHG